jgi:iron(III) transport system ATP-binding protein
MPSDAYLVLRNVSKRFSPRQPPAVWRVDLSAGEGCLLALLGPSGCGKTTLLRLIAGFEAPDEGSICVADRKMAGEGSWTPPEHRGVGMVFQDFALFPHLTVYDNVAFGLRYSSWRGRDGGRRAMHVIEVAGLRGIENRYPHEISGGQQQRVAVARALVGSPSILLADEPTGNLDSANGESVMELLSELHRGGATICMVTHDPRYALLAERTVRLFDGRIVEESVGASS